MQIKYQNSRSLPSVATSSMGLPSFCDMYPNTENIANPEKKLVTQLTELVNKASLLKSKCLKQL